MIDVITMSSKGQFVIPRDIREEMGIAKQDKFAIVHDKDSILLKKISRDQVQKSMGTLLDKLSDKFEQTGITKKDIAKEVRKTRSR